LIKFYYTIKIRKSKKNQILYVWVFQLKQIHLNEIYERLFVFYLF